MSKLPNFKEGFIFDATQNTTTEEQPFVATKSTFTLFKLASIDDYNKHYEYWKYDKNNGETVDIMEIKYYNDMSFLTNTCQVIVWNKGIYLVEPYFNQDTIYTFNLTRCADKEGITECDTKTFYFQLQLSPYVEYDNDYIRLGTQGYEITIDNPVTTLDWIYDINDTSDELKYYQFLLYNTDEQGVINKCVVDTGKIYTNTTNGNGFICNSLDDNSKYILVGYCVSQSGQKLDLPDLTIKTAYTTGRIYANLTIELNKQLAENTIYAEMVNLIGNTTNGEPIYINDEKIDLKLYDNTVIFTDDYGLIKNNFLIRLWINGIIDKDRVTILKLSSPNGSDYIEVYYENAYFYAIKYSCGLISRYISNAVSEDDVLNGNIYLSILHCNGRIDIYATSYEESEAIAL